MGLATVRLPCWLIVSPIVGQNFITKIILSQRLWVKTSSQTFDSVTKIMGQNFITKIILSQRLWVRTLSQRWDVGVWLMFVKLEALLFSRDVCFSSLVQSGCSCKLQRRKAVPAANICSLAADLEVSVVSLPDKQHVFLLARMNDRSKWTPWKSSLWMFLLHCQASHHCTANQNRRRLGRWILLAVAMRMKTTSGYQAHECAEAEKCIFSEIECASTHTVVGKEIMFFSAIINIAFRRWARILRKFLAFFLLTVCAEGKKLSSADSVTSLRDPTKRLLHHWQSESLQLAPRHLMPESIMMSLKKSCHSSKRWSMMPWFQNESQKRVLTCSPTAKIWQEEEANSPPWKRVRVLPLKQQRPAKPLLSVSLKRLHPEICLVTYQTH